MFLASLAFALTLKFNDLSVLILLAYLSVLALQRFVAFSNLLEIKLFPISKFANKMTSLTVEVKSTYAIGSSLKYYEN